MSPVSLEISEGEDIPEALFNFGLVVGVSLSDLELSANYEFGCLAVSGDIDLFDEDFWSSGDCEGQVDLFLEDIDVGQNFDLGVGISGISVESEQFEDIISVEGAPVEDLSALDRHEFSEFPFWFDQLSDEFDFADFVDRSFVDLVVKGDPLSIGTDLKLWFLDSALEESPVVVEVFEKVEVSFHKGGVVESHTGEEVFQGCGPRTEEGFEFFGGDLLVSLYDDRFNFGRFTFVDVEPEVELFSDFDPSDIDFDVEIPQAVVDFYEPIS